MRLDGKSDGLAGLLKAFREIENGKAHERVGRLADDLALALDARRELGRDLAVKDLPAQGDVGGVDEAIDRYLAPNRELLAVLQLFRRSQEIIFRYEIEEGPKVFETMIHGKPFTLYNDTIIAFGEDGKEIFRTTVEEPIHVRPKERTNAV